MIEGGLRSAMALPIPIDRSLAPDVNIRAIRKPDFLWLGTAWWIEYESPVAFELQIGPENSSRVPAGRHRIVSNHDYRNLKSFGLAFIEDGPDVVVARKLPDDE
jgi:hypothetical protein